MKLILPCLSPSVMLTPCATPQTGVGGALTVLNQALRGLSLSPNLVVVVLVMILTSVPVSTIARASIPLILRLTYCAPYPFGFLGFLFMALHSPIKPNYIISTPSPCSYASFSFRSRRIAPRLFSAGHLAQPCGHAYVATLPFCMLRLYLRISMTFKLHAFKHIGIMILEIWLLHFKFATVSPTMVLTTSSSTLSGL